MNPRSPRPPWPLVIMTVLTAAMACRSSDTLLEATRRGDPEDVRQRLEEGADLEARTEYHDQTALQLAVQKGHVEIAVLLAAAGAKVDAHHRGGLLQLLVCPGRQIANGKLAPKEEEARRHMLLSLLLDYGAWPEGDGGKKPLVCAAQAGDLVAAALLLAHGALVDTSNPLSSPLLAAVRADDSEMVGWLLAHGASPAVYDGPSFRAALFGHLLGGGDPAILAAFHDAWEEPPLHEAAAAGDVERVERLLAEGARPDQRNTLGELPVHQAIAARHAALVRMLLQVDAATDAFPDLVEFAQWAADPTTIAVVRDATRPLE